MVYNAWMDATSASHLEALESAGCVLLRWTAAGELCFLSREGRALYGAASRAAEVLGPVAALVAVLRREGAASSETTVEGAAGRRSMLWSHRPLGRPSGAWDGTGEIISVGTDVTPYHELARSLEASQQTLTELADHLQQCVWIKDPSTVVSGRMLYVSPAFERIFGVAPEQLHGRPDALYELVHPEDRPRFRDATAAQFERGYDLEYRLLRRDGEVRWVWSRAVPVRDGRGQVVRLVGITEDITARKDAENRIRELNAELEQMYRREQELSRTDELTGLGNRLRFVEEAERLWGAARRGSLRTGQPRSLAVVTLDLDYLKLINDRHGHAAGDTCLRAMAQVLRASIREVDVAARVGGDEFVLLLPDASLEQARQVADRVLQGLAQAAVVHEGAEGPVRLRISASIGVAAQDGADPEGSVSRLQLRADEALYAAKEAGRQCVATAGEPATTGAAPDDATPRSGQ